MWPIRTALPPAARITISHGAWPWLRTSKPLAKAIREPSGDQLGCSSSALLRGQAPKPAAVGADDVELTARRARGGRARRRVRVVEGDEREPRAVGRPGRREPVHGRGCAGASRRRRRGRASPRAAAGSSTRAARTRSSSRPATRRPRGRSRPRAAARGAGRAPSIVKSEAVGATTDCTTRVKAIRRPSGENEGIASNGPVVSCRAAPPRAETAISRIRSVPQ